MSFPLRIAGALLLLAAIPPARSEGQRPAPEAQNDPQAQSQLRRVVADEAQPRRAPAREQVQQVGHLSPEERQKLRQDVNDAGRAYYHHYHHPHRAQY